MKVKRLIVISLIFATSVFAVLIWWNSSSALISIEPSEVLKIEVFDGNTGKNICITNQEDIDHIIVNLNAVEMKKEKISVGYMGYSFRTTIFKTDSDVYKEFIINSSDTIRKDPFFYSVNSDSIDYNFIMGLFEKMENRN